MKKKTIKIKPKFLKDEKGNVTGVFLDINDSNSLANEIINLSKKYNIPIEKNLKEDIKILKK